MIGSIRLWDIRASQAGFDNCNLEERDGESGTDCSDIKTGKTEDWMNTKTQGTNGDCRGPALCICEHRWAYE